MGGLTLESIDSIGKVLAVLIASVVVNRLLVLVLNTLENALFRFIRPFYD